MSVSSRRDLAAKAIELGNSNLATHPATGVFQIYGGHLLLARAALDTSDSDFYEALRTAADVVQHGFSDYHVLPAPERLNDCFIFAAAANHLECAAKLAAIDPDYSNSHPFDVALNYAFRSLLLHTTLPPAIYRPIRSEAALFNALSSVGTPRFSTADTDKYWRATRHKRYKHTIHEHRNLFSEALQKLHEVA